MTSLDAADLKALEQTRQRLFQLTSSLASLQQSIHMSDPLPPWNSLQSLATIISQHLATLSAHLTTHHDLLSSTIVYPLPTFPGRTEESLLGQLLRKKLEPAVEDWVDRGREIATEALGNGNNQSANGQTSGDHAQPSATVGGLPDPTSSASSSRLTEKELDSLWDWARVAANEEARARDWDADYTREEQESGIQNVITGLRRKLRDPDEESSDEEDNEEAIAGDEDEERNIPDDEMEVVGVRRKSGAAGLEFQLRRESEHRAAMMAKKPSLPMTEVFRFMHTGAEPRGVGAEPFGPLGMAGVRR
ncbi:hypothetical protein L228DRAFT_242628 [Xylona heveae TC161]|uniref:Mediator of RNA polymerase II transcription subunit 8 n=1 Tax=Xylona heveae (strain CBS 132557 / TC161) TaxID=1328760 RepID=A0A165JG81_XYLHT|nr:hypothetical protein L228DRAFT_242628 [Xylona heveae TC161]KZF26196.1 hypothetical protein L228DRAFT_242628 [Xylona heveae TC161]